ncbi:UNKNOWN [Stylonychia lemnae]|uniref:Uncharacterized protein n=1 Tax=Stylonychia lemnae TaxID=5949 RepID=A0A078AHY0_STYLE|nr:UNKNOWN [Stylonychia lemnae]|eukprot:CDW81854.1 UNKNOWN [Stylonychia lemnae]
MGVCQSININKIIPDLDQISVGNVAKDLISIEKLLKEYEIFLNHLRDSLRHLDTIKIRIKNGEIIYKAQKALSMYTYYDEKGVMLNQVQLAQNIDRRQAEGRQAVNNVVHDQNREVDDFIESFKQSKQLKVKQQQDDQNQNKSAEQPQPDNIRQIQDDNDKDRVDNQNNLEQPENLLLKIGHNKRQLNNQEDSDENSVQLTENQQAEYFIVEDKREFEELNQNEDQNNNDQSFIACNSTLVIQDDQGLI